MSEVRAHISCLLSNRGVEWYERKELRCRGPKPPHILSSFPEHVLNFLKITWFFPSSVPENAIISHHQKEVKGRGGGRKWTYILYSSFYFRNTGKSPPILSLFPIYQIHQWRTFFYYKSKKPIPKKETFWKDNRVSHRIQAVWRTEAGTAAGTPAGGVWVFPPVLPSGGPGLPGISWHCANQRQGHAAAKKKASKASKSLSFWGLWFLLWEGELRRPSRKCLHCCWQFQGLYFSSLKSRCVEGFLEQHLF